MCPTASFSKERDTTVFIYRPFRHNTVVAGFLCFTGLLRPTRHVFFVSAPGIPGTVHYNYLHIFTKYEEYKQYRSNIIMYRLYTSGYSRYYSTIVTWLLKSLLQHYTHWSNIHDARKIYLKQTKIDKYLYLFYSIM